MVILIFYLLISTQSYWNCTYYKCNSTVKVFRIIVLIIHISLFQPTDVESEEESDDDSEYSEASEDSGDTEGKLIFLRQLGTLITLNNLLLSSML